MNKHPEKVSIILPTYNGGKYLRQAIDTCLEQTHKNIELIIVDDSSTDETPEIVQSYRDERIRYIRHEKNMRLPGSLNTGFARTVGEYLTWTSDDNLYDEQAIEKMLSFLKTMKCEFVYCDYYLFKDDKLDNRRVIRLPDNINLEKHNDVGACFLYSRKVREVTGDYDLDTFLAEDYDYWIRVSRNFKMCHLDEPLYFYRTHAASLALSKFIDVRICNALVRLNHRLIDVDQAVDFLVDVIAGRYWGLRRINRIISDKLFSGKISSILIDYKAGRMGIAETKSALRDILMADWKTLRRRENK